jgi:hypothetical protein
MRDKAKAVALDILTVIILAICAALALANGPWLTRFYALAACYTCLFGIFMYNSSRAGYSLVDLPVLVSIRAYLSFGLAPVAGLLLLGNDYGPPFTDYAGWNYLPMTLAIVILGMASFWIVVRMVRSKPIGMTRPASQHIPARAFPCALILVLLGTIVRMYLLRNHMYGFVGDQDLLAGRVAEVQPLLFIKDFGFWGMIILGILRYQKPSKAHSYAFWGAFLLEIAWGAIGGQKGLTLRNVAIVALLYVIYRKRLPVRWVAIGIISFVLIYPIMDSYRAIVHGTGDLTVDSVSSLAGAQKDMAENMTGISRSDYLIAGLSEALYRIDLLPSAAVIVKVADSAKISRPLDTGARIWMLPALIAVPRLIWANKPKMNEGQLMAQLLGNTQGNTFAATHFGDAYLQGHLFGEVVYCGALGFICALISRISLRSQASPSALFVAVALYWTVTGLEADVLQEFAGILKLWLMLIFVAWIVFSSRKGRVRKRKHSTNLVPREPGPIVQNSSPAFPF